jgi:uncharacterized protein DUF4062
MIGSPLRVFISSTTDDLGDYRQKVADVVTRLGLVAVTMETFGASSLAPEGVSVERVREADVLVGLIGYRYGHVPAGSSKSVTEMEYDVAAAAQKLVLMYVPLAAFMGSQRARSQPVDDGAQRFIQRIQRESHTCGAYADRADLPGIVAADLHRVITGGAPGILAYRKGLRELRASNYDSAIFDLGWAMHLLPDDGAPSFLLALALLRGRRPRRVTLDEVRRIEALLEVSARLSPGRAVFALWGAIEVDYFVRNGFHHPHEEQARQFWMKALAFTPDAENFDLIRWLQPDIASEYLMPLM